MFTTLPRVSLPPGAAPGLDSQAAEGASGGPPNAGALATSHPEQMTEGLSPFLPNFEITEEGDREGWEQ